MGFPIFLTLPTLSGLDDALTPAQRAALARCKEGADAMMQRLIGAEDIDEATAREVRLYLWLSVRLLGVVRSIKLDLWVLQGLGKVQDRHRELVGLLGEDTPAGDAADYGYRVLERLVRGSFAEIPAALDKAHELAFGSFAGFEAVDDPARLIEYLIPGEVTRNDVLAVQLILTAMTLEELMVEGVSPRLKQVAMFMGTTGYRVRSHIVQPHIDPFDDLSQLERNMRLLRSLQTLGDQLEQERDELPEF